MAEGCGTELLWLVPYPPDFSPIEQCWSKIKAYLRGAKARMQGQLDEALAAAVKLATKSDIHGWFKHRGYSTPPPAVPAYATPDESAARAVIFRLMPSKPSLIANQPPLELIVAVFQTPPPRASARLLFHTDREGFRRKE